MECRHNYTRISLENLKKKFCQEFSRDSFSFKKKFFFFFPFFKNFERFELGYDRRRKHRVNPRDCCLLSTRILADRSSRKEMPLRLGLLCPNKPRSSDFFFLHLRYFRIIRRNEMNFQFVQFCSYKSHLFAP